MNTITFVAPVAPHLTWNSSEVSFQVSLFYEPELFA